MKQFDIPFTYRSNLINAIKEKRKQDDKMKKDFTPTIVDCGNVIFYIARHFGFCYGVENAIEIAFKTISENKGKRIFLLSEMIHNPKVNEDLIALGVKFLQDTKGKILVDFEALTSDDIVITPAFGTTVEIENILKGKGIKIEKFDTTCPFVEKVWKRGEQIAKNDYTIIIHGKPTHEETRATFSHAKENAASIVISDMEEAILLAQYIKGEKKPSLFYEDFRGRYSTDFDMQKDLNRIGVVNQTTMLASETQAIAEFLKNTVVEKFQPVDEGSVFADTRDTLCYATNDNQAAAFGLLNVPADFAIVVGGYNSSNTTHLVELAEQKLNCYFINDASKIISKDTIAHFDIHQQVEVISHNYWSEEAPLRILLTSGASCPDAVVEKVIEKFLALSDSPISVRTLEQRFTSVN